MSGQQTTAQAPQKTQHEYEIEAKLSLMSFWNKHLELGNLVNAEDVTKIGRHLFGAEQWNKAIGLEDKVPAPMTDPGVQDVLKEEAKGYLFTCWTSCLRADWKRAADNVYELGEKVFEGDWYFAVTGSMDAMPKGPFR